MCQKRGRPDTTAQGVSGLPVPATAGRRFPILVRRNRTNGSSPIAWGTLSQKTKNRVLPG
nr:MAG TPA: hypothetical protein [Caudoviricetes sp.]